MIHKRQWERYLDRLDRVLASETAYLVAIVILAACALKILWAAP